ncbi:Mth938-like domain-containing protein [Alysiella crassa]|uniref:Protein of uncharacterized function (DUF498/DUF598) n=1 Tax=Alysiella crassa TaxID=153491 RepID=A0A376BNP4_9NEIS|nr:Mth938-like domain-containing protein [Alysiella crassa]UOP06663.1 Mth938-like domain-containing protein [Alysiella crassa]SSY71235.1 Protein of uncharacterised function (DUF498/DUF598) [Alysiella crassa]
MEFVEQDLGHLLTVQSYQNGALEVAGQVYDYPIILGDEIIRLPENSVADLTAESFQAALNAGVALIIIGTGATQAFLSPKVLAELAQRGVGVECMNTAAACRTLAMVQGEGRRVWAWLWV